MSYTGQKVAPHQEVPALSYEPFIRPFEAPECDDVPVEGTVFHHGLKPQTKVPPSCSLWTNHTALDRRIPFTIPLNQLEYLSLGYLFKIILTWNRRSETSYRREAALSLTPSVSPDYDT